MKSMSEEEMLWYQRYTTARARDRLGAGWPSREEWEQMTGMEARSDLYVKLLLTLSDEQLDLTEKYLDAQNDERDYWLRRCFFLGYRMAEEDAKQNFARPEI
ncbi:MAG: hypothetical protein EOM52_07170 [Clostridia bacterium]|nr:hypothetical protein [Clostridia bacterium]